ncbi:helix-turn-helix transcriptional regulator [Mycoavidus sp. SF9855]|uniref:helix-turn-helix transcriptional regulator n=1 Tax=Mycoavidus sp. SF9855 TaxID=2968475 RepID=UPI00211C4C6B|nr:autoinducer binding domain-containing protein [Mycoavidus sp. SF9855]UUM21060.1 autoinducer binding domain-containing protein [Mycoavidus sp. SF9855]
MENKKQEKNNPVIEINRLQQCENDGQLHAILLPLVQYLGASQYIFLSMVMDKEDEAHSYRYLIGCRPEWLQVYQHRHWYMNDPYIIYARMNIEPKLGSSIPLLSAGQSAMVSTARQYGFKSNLIVPTHCRASSLMGVLHVANQCEPNEGGESSLVMAQPLFRAIAGSLLDLRIAELRRASARKFNLNARELDILCSIKQGAHAPQIATKFDVSVATIYVLYKKVNEKMGVNRISEAVKLAVIHELID